MSPFGGLDFFYIMFLLLVPAIIMGLMGKSFKKYAIFINLLIILLIFHASLRQSIQIVLFFIGELILVKLNFYIVKKHKNRVILWIMVFLSLTPLFIVKGGHNFVAIPLGFLGVSYLSFKVIQILVETYDGLIENMSLSEFSYFLLFFPSISSGPIDRSRRFVEDINKQHTKEEYEVLLRVGIYKLFLGIAYKFIFGTLIFTYWLKKIPGDMNVIHVINYMYAYSLYLFFDFAGYSSIAVGTSYILGVRTPDNFNLPFISKDIKDFWNRWHMSLSFWFRDFVYTRFVMAALKNKWFKSRFTASYIGYMVTMLTMGIWHGTDRFYLVYGLYHGSLIVATDFFQRKSKFYKKYKNTKSFTIGSTVLTIHLVCFGFLIFSGHLFK
jgi:membrane protein involved in D-alanine export